MKLTDKQREALRALADVMEDHKVAIYAYGANIKLLEHNDVQGFVTTNIADDMAQSSDIKQLLQEQE